MSLIGELKRRSVLRVSAAYVAVSWLLVQVVETVAPAFGFGEAAVRYTVIVLGIGLIPVLALSWAFELTPEGLKRDRDVDRTAAPSPGATKRLDRLIVVALALALVYFAADKFVFDPERDAAREEEVARTARSAALVESYGDKSIAVLPFVNMSADPEQEYFSEGIAEEILNLLAKVQELRVISRSSAFTFKGKDVHLGEVARQLNVAHVLEGSVRKSGDQVRITAQLIDARTDSHLWSETYDRTLDDVFAIQDEIAAAVVAELRVKLLGEAPRSTRTDPQAFALALQARRLLDEWGDPQMTYTLLQQSVQLDPRYVPAWTAIARLYWRLGFFDYVRNDAPAFRDRPVEEIHRLRREAIDHALAIDPNNAGALALRAGDIALRDRQAAAREFERAIAQDPNDQDVLRPAAVFASALGRFDIAIDLSRRAVDRDPLCQTCWYNLGRHSRSARRYDEALAALKTYESIGGEGAFYSTGIVFLLQGDAAQALEKFERADSDAPPHAAIAMAMHSLGREPEAEANLAQARASLESRLAPGPLTEYATEGAFSLAQACAWMNRPDCAFEWLEVAVRDDLQRPFYFGDELFHPLYSNLHADPRWAALMQRLGLAPEQLAAIRFEVALRP